jgi:hypothetical protein
MHKSEHQLSTDSCAYFLTYESEDRHHRQFDAPLVYAAVSHHKIVIKRTLSGHICQILIMTLNLCSCPRNANPCSGAKGAKFGLNSNDVTGIFGAGSGRHDQYSALADPIKLLGFCSKSRSSLALLKDLTPP